MAILVRSIKCRMWMASRISHAAVSSSSKRSQIAVQMRGPGKVRMSPRNLQHFGNYGEFEI